MNIEARHKLVTMLQSDEGYKRYPYTDTTGHLTIGIGRNLVDVGISLDEALVLLNNDIARVDSALTKYVLDYPTLDDPRKAVLISMAFNMGVAGLLKFKAMLDFIHVKDWESAAREMHNSEWWKQVGDRVDRLANIMRTGLL